MSFAGILVLIFVFIVIDKVQSKCISVECESDGSGDVVCPDWWMNGVGNEMQQLFGWWNLQKSCSRSSFGSQFKNVVASVTFRSTDSIIFYRRKRKYYLQKSTPKNFHFKLYHNAVIRNIYRKLFNKTRLSQNIRFIHIEQWGRQCFTKHLQLFQWRIRIQLWDQEKTKQLDLMTL